MNKTISIDIAGFKFDIHEDAYQKLDSYLSQIKKHFQKFADGEEIIEDIQRRIAEKFKEQQKKEKVINIKEVERIIESMGSINDFNEAEKEELDGKSLLEKILGRFKHTRLLRDSDNKKVAGVLAGIANYIDLDPAIVRILFSVLTAFAVVISQPLGAFFIISYFALWASMSEAKSITQKLEMRGEKVTLNKIESEAKKNNVDKNNEKNLTSRQQSLIGIFTATVQSMWYGIRAIFPIAIRILGMFIFVSSILILATITTLGIFAIFNINSPLIGIPLWIFFTDFSYHLLAFLAYCVAAIPLLWGIILGVSLIKLKSVFRSLIFLSTLGIWVVCIVVFGFQLFTLIPDIKQKIKDNPGMVEPHAITVDVKDFDKITAKGNIALSITQGDVYSVKVVGLNQTIEQTKFDVTDGLLHITSEEGVNNCIICLYKGVKIELQMPTLRSLDIKNNVNVYVDQFVTEQFSVVADGNVHIHAKIDTQTLQIDLSKNTHMNVEGSAESLNASIHESSYLMANELTAQDVQVSTTHNAFAHITAINSLNAESKDNSLITYRALGTVIKNAHDNSDIEPYFNPYWNNEPIYGSQHPTFYMNYVASNTTLEELITYFGPFIAKTDYENEMQYDFKIDFETLIYVTMNSETQRITRLELVRAGKTVDTREF